MLETRYAYASIRMTSEALRNPMPWAEVLQAERDRWFEDMRQSVFESVAEMERWGRVGKYRRRAARRGPRKRGRRM